MFLFAIAIVVVTLGVAAVGALEPRGGDVQRGARMLGVCPLWAASILAAMAYEHVVSWPATVAASSALVALAAGALLFGWWPAIRAPRERRDDVRILDNGFPATLRRGATQHPTPIGFLEFTCATPDVGWRIRIAGGEWRLHVPPWATIPVELPVPDSYTVFATDADAARSAFSSFLVSWIDRLHSGDIVVDIGGGQLRVRDTHREHEAQQEDEFIECAYSLAADVRERLRPPGAAAVVDVTPPTPAAPGEPLGAEPTRGVEFACRLPDSQLSVRIVGEAWRAHVPSWAHEPIALPAWRDYGLFATDWVGAATLLRDPVPQLVRDLDRLHPGSVIIELHAGRLTIRDTTHSTGPERPTVFEHCATMLAAHLRDRLAQHVPRTRDVEIVAETTNALATCQVCGTQIGASRVECRRCRTPHHHECWTFNGRCSTYGCRSRQFDGRATDVTVR